MTDPQAVFGRFTAEPLQPPPDADDLLCFAEESIKEARFGYNDNAVLQKRYRLQALDAAIEHLLSAKALLNPGPEMASQETCEMLAEAAREEVA